MFALGDTISRQAPKLISLKTPSMIAACIVASIAMCVGGMGLNWLLSPILSGVGCFISMFGSGFIYGLSAKFMDEALAHEHHYTAYNLWCFFGDFAGFFGQSELVVDIAASVCGGQHYPCMCVEGI